MAITKIHPIKATVDKAIDYICKSEKTDEKIFISSFACSPETAALDFKYTLDHTRDHAVNEAFHLIQAFGPGEISFDEAHSIGQELADRMLEGKYSYVMTTHIDKGHVHNHLIFCAADNLEHNKYHDCKQSYYRIRKISDDLCREHNLSVVEPGKKRGQKYNEWQSEKNDSSWKTQIRKDINQAIKAVTNYDEFLALMKAKGYEMKEGKYISFRPIGKERFVRGSEKSLGANYTKEKILERIENKRSKTFGDSNNDRRIRRLIDKDSHPKYAENAGLQKWATKENLKIAAKTYSLMNEQGIDSFSELDAKIFSLQEQVKASNESIKALEQRTRSLAEIMKYAEQYQENKPFNDRYELAKDKEKFFRKYEGKIILFAGAERMLMRQGVDLDRMNIGKLKAEYSSLSEQRNGLVGTVKDRQWEVSELNLIKENLGKYTDLDSGNRGSKNIPLR